MKERKMIKELSMKRLTGVILAVCLVALFPAGAVHAADF